jgi:hypothetical protein
MYKFRKRMRVVNSDHMIWLDFQHLREINNTQAKSTKEEQSCILYIP